MKRITAISALALIVGCSQIKEEKRYSMYGTEIEETPSSSVDSDNFHLYLCPFLMPFETLNHYLNCAVKGPVKSYSKILDER